MFPNSISSLLNRNIQISNWQNYQK